MRGSMFVFRLNMNLISRFYSNHDKGKLKEINDFFQGIINLVQIKLLYSSRNSDLIILIGWF